MYLFFDLFRRDPDITYIDEGEYLFQEGEPCLDRMFVLVSGTAEVLVGDSQVEIATAGTILGEMALVERREARSASVRALTRCGFAVISEKRFHFLVTEAPQFAIEVMRILAQRLRRVDQCIALGEFHGEYPRAGAY